MKAIAVRRGESSPTLLEHPVPEPSPGEALVRTLRVGVDGTDHEVLAGGHGAFPEGEEYMVLGHEAVGVVVDPNGTGLSAGEVVAPTVRRRPDGEGEGGKSEGGKSEGGESGAGRNDYFARGEPDMAPEGEYHERGISGAHGFMAEYFTSPAESLVTVPPALAEWGFLVEPASITVKAMEHARASRSAFEWSPESALVLGNGSLGLLTLAMFRERFDRLYCLGRRDRPDPTIDLVEALDATYVDSRETPVPAVASAYEGMDVVYEATGYAKHAFESIRALAPNGVAALLGVPDDWTFEVDGGELHRELVLHNKALVGSVNSNARHFERAVDELAGLPDWFLADLVTGVYGVESFERAFARDDTTIKAAVEFGTR